MYTDGMTDAQASAVMCDDARVVVVAGAGAGKTRVIERRIRRLVGTKTSAQKVLAITFTNKAADEMRHRLEAIGWRRRDMPSIRTFHGFCVTVLRSAPSVIGRTRDFWIVDELDREELIRRAAVEIGSKVKTLRSMEKDQTVMTEYRRLIRRADAVDFDLIEEGALLALRCPGNPWVGAFEHVIVDEFQDSSPAQVEILHRLGAQLFIVGDPRQAIYGFRGADPTFIRAAFTGSAVGATDAAGHPLYTDAQPWTPIYLADNFRSGEAIVRTANTICCDDQPMTAQRDGGHVTHGVAEAVEVLLDLQTRFAPEQIAVLARRWSDLELLHAQLALEGRPTAPLFVYRPQDDAWASMLARAFMALVQLVRSPHADHLVARVLLQWPCEADPPIRALARRAMHERRNLSEIAAETNTTMSAVLDLRRRRDSGPAPSSSPRSPLHIVDSVLGLVQHPLHSVELRALLSGMRFFGLDELEEWHAGRSHMDTTRAPAGAMHGMTIHASKGLEFDAVVVLDVRDGVFPKASTGPAREEDRRVLYVGATRAMHELHLVREAEIMPAFGPPGPQPTYPTPFLPQE